MKQIYAIFSLLSNCIKRGYVALFANPLKNLNLSLHQSNSKNNCPVFLLKTILTVSFCHMSQQTAWNRDGLKALEKLLMPICQKSCRWKKNMFSTPWRIWLTIFFSTMQEHFVYGYRGGSRIFFRRGCTHLLLYFNTNNPHFFFCRIPVV